LTSLGTVGMDMPTSTVQAEKRVHTPEQKRAYRQRPEVKALQKKHAATHHAKKRALGLPITVPIDPERRASYVAKRQQQTLIVKAKLEERKTEANARRLMLKPSKRALTNAKHRRHRALLRSAAIKAMGGECEWCTFDIECGLQFDHITPVRGGKKRRHRKDESDNVYRMIVRGQTEGIQLLCACCHVIKTKMVDDIDGQLSLNLIHHEPKMPAPIPLFECVADL
jgi:hypothetical protein